MWGFYGSGLGSLELRVEVTDLNILLVILQAPTSGLRVQDLVSAAQGCLLLSRRGLIHLSPLNILGTAVG